MNEWVISVLHPLSSHMLRHSAARNRSPSVKQQCSLESNVISVYTFSASEADPALGSLGCKIYCEILKNGKKVAACDFSMNIES